MTTEDKVTWVVCPRCKGNGYEPSSAYTQRITRDIPMEWCKLCLPARHKSGMSIPPRQIAKAWQEERGQRVGRVQDHVEVRYVLDPRPGKGLD